MLITLIDGYNQLLTISLPRFRSSNFTFVSLIHSDITELDSILHLISDSAGQNSSTFSALTYVNWIQCCLGQNQVNNYALTGL